MTRVLLIDNYDSFTYNLAQYLGELGAEVIVYRNDAIGLEKALKLKPTHLVISPGPGNPSQAGVSSLFIRHFAQNGIPVLGVCLGHQCIGAVFGGKVVGAGRLMHGKTSMIHHDGKGILRGVPSPFEAARYHSLMVRGKGLPKKLEVTARTKDGVVMGVRHRTLPVEGVQFHPESIATKGGKTILKNFLSMTRRPKKAAGKRSRK